MISLVLKPERASLGDNKNPTRNVGEKGGFMRTLKNEKSIAIFVFLVLGVILVAFSVNCKKAEKKTTERLAVSQEMLLPIFGDPKDGKSGVVDVSETDEGLILAYHFATEETSDFDDDIGRDLGPKIRELYKQFPQVDRITFGVSIPTTGNELGWKDYVSFVMTRKLVTETDWTTILDDDLLRVALEVKYAE
jgi:hypothetical protein